MNASDFSYTSDPYGYKLSYKGQPIGGAGVLDRSTKHPSTAKADRELFARGAQMEIAALVDGRGPGFMRLHIAQIDQQQPIPVH